MLWGDALGGDARFGFNADFTAVLPLAAPDEALLWVNHEFVNIKIPTSPNVGVWEQTFPLLTGRSPTVDDMKRDVGGSVLHIRDADGLLGRRRLDPRRVR